MIMDDAHVPWLVLLNTPTTGPVQHKKLLDIYKTPDNILSAPYAELAQSGLKKEALDHLTKTPLKRIEDGVSWLEQSDHHLVTIHDSNYPELLREISDAPVALFVTGDLAVLNTKQIGIVGSRNPTAGGRKIAKLLATQLSELGLTITSGLALGIDYCSHAGALDANGKTIAVLGNGPDRIYPARHKEIAGLIAASGAIVSEFPPGVPPLPANFPRRNRIISGLSLGVLVVEAAMQSGSLITARYALEQGREVFAVPGSIYNPLSKGCHHLIKQGAKLVETIQDVVEELNINITVVYGNSQHVKPGSGNHAGFDEDQLKLLEHLSFDPVTVDKLIEISGLTADAVSSMLLVLEIQGIVSSSGGLYTRIN
jgi:DNA processing protein